MRVVVAAGSFAPEAVGASEGSGFGPVAATAAVVRGWSSQAPHTRCEPFPMSDGGFGFTEVFAAHHGVGATPVVVTGPTGEPVPASYVMAEVGGRSTAYLEAAQAAGRHLASPAALADPGRLTSRGIGELLVAAREAGAERIVLGCGDLASHDGGAGLFEGLGAGSDLAGLSQIREQWSRIQVVLAHATELPLLGFHGASAALGSEHGVSADLTQSLENRMGRWTEQVRAVVPYRTDLLTGQQIRPERTAGSGVGGGVGYAMVTLGATLVPGARLVLEHTGAASALPGALVVTGQGIYDWRSVADGVVAEVAKAALTYAAPTVVLADSVQVGRREGMSLGISGTYDRREGEDLEALASRVARTWSPAP